MPRKLRTATAEPAHWSANFVCTPGEWPFIESAAEKENNYLCETSERAVRRDLYRERSRSHKYKTYAQLKALLKRYGLPSNGRQRVLLARLTAYEATPTSPPFIAVTSLLPFPFLKLPNEIRNLVYKELLTLKGTPRSRVVNILRANKQIYNEAKGLLYSLNTIRIEIDCLNCLWLRDASPLNISISQKQHYSDRDRINGLAPPNQWLKLPTYLGRCEKVKIILTTIVIYGQLFTEAYLNTMVMHFNSLIYTKLMQHQYLKTIHVELDFTREYHFRSTVTDQEMRSFERGCLDSLCRLRGMRAVHLKGFTFIDPFDVFLAKRAMLLPSSNRRDSCLTMPQMMQNAPQWWQLRNLSIYCDPSRQCVATNHNLGDPIPMAFQWPAWGSLTRARNVRRQKQSTQPYHASMSRRHLIMLDSLLQPQPPPKPRTLQCYEALVKHWACA